MADAVIFDVDGVLLDTEPLGIQATTQAIRELYGYDVDAKVFHEFQGEGIEEYLAGGLAKYGIHLDDLSQLVERRLKIQEELMQKNLRVFPGVRSLLHKLQNSQIKMGIATSSRREKLVAAFQAVSMELGIFDAVLTGDDVQHHKPDPEIYSKAADILGIAPGQCLVVEDAIFGVHAAKAAGMLCIAVTNSFPKKSLIAEGADMILDSLETLSLEDIVIL